MIPFATMRGLAASIITGRQMLKCQFKFFSSSTRPEYSTMSDTKCNKRVIADALGAANARIEPALVKKLENNEETYQMISSRIMRRGVEKETDEPLKGETIGKIPEWIDGTLIRNGPGLNKVGEFKYNHLFDFLAMLRKFRIKNGEVTFECKFLKSDTYKKNMAAQRIVVDEFGTRRSPDPCQTLFQRFWSTFETPEPTDNCVVGVYQFKDEYYAFTETPMIHRIDIDSLESLKKVDLRSKTKLSIVHNSSHPQVMPDGTVCNVGIVVGNGPPKYTVVEFPKTKKSNTKEDDVFAEAKIVAQVPVRWKFTPGYMHSFGITPNYSVIIEQPLGMSVLGMVKCKILGSTMNNAMVWYDGYPTLIHAVSHSTNKDHVFVCEPFAFMHTINQYEEDGHVVMDVCVMKNADFLNGVTMDELEAKSQDPKFASLFRSRPMRFVLPLNPSPEATDGNLVTLKDTQAKAFRSKKNGEIHVEPEILADVGVEMPKVQYPALCGQKYRYFYGIGLEPDTEPGLIAKIDTKNKTFTTWNDKDAYASEPIFVPSPNQKEEDDGVLLTSVIGTKGDFENRLSLVVLNAKDLKEVGRTVFTLDKPMPMDFHGWFTNKI